jgi:hypothetical protein
MGPYEDTIVVECPHCGDEYELEPDGLGEGAMELIEAYEAEMKNRSESEKEREAEDEKEKSTSIPKTQYGFPIPDGLRALWAARAIYSVEPEFYVDILPDRQCMCGECHSEERKDLCSWLNTEGIEALQTQCRELDLRPNESRVVEFHSKGFVIKGTPNASHGYLYLVAYRIPLPSAES